jgi:tetratricopeptide (TPR) repeat protein
MKRTGALTLLLLSAFMGFAQSKSALADSNAIKLLFYDALRYKIGDNYNKALENFNKIITLDPKQADAYYEIASLSYRQNKLQEAEFALSKAIELNPENIWFWKLMGELHKRRGDMTGLVEVLNRLIVMEPGQEAYYFDRSNALAIAGNVTEALKSYEELEQKFGVSTASQRAKKMLTRPKGTKSVESEAADLLSESPPDLKSYLYASGLLMKNGKKQEAFNLLLKARAMDSLNLELNLAMVDYYVAENNIAAAADLLKGLTAVNKEDPRLFAMYGDLLYKQGKLQQALQEYLKSQTLSRNLYVVWEQVLSIYIQQNDFQKAIKKAEEGLSLYPNQAVLYYYLAFAQYREGLTDQALENIKVADQLGTDEKVLLASINDVHALILMKKGQYEQAKTKVEFALQNNGSKKSVYLEHLGDILFLKGEVDEALKQWKLAKLAGNSSEKLKQKIDEKKYIK